MAIGGVDPRRWAGFCRAIGRPELESDERFDSPGKRIRARQELNELLDEHFSTAPTAKWVEALEREDIFCAPVLDYEQVSSREQVAANGYVTEMGHPKTGRTRVLPHPIAFSETPVEAPRPEPGLGEHTDTVLEEFGFAAQEIEGFRAEGVV